MSITQRASVDGETIAAVREVQQQIVQAWAKHDADAFAEVFTEDGTMILPKNVFSKGRAEIRAFMAAAFAGPFKGTQVTGAPEQVRVLGPDVAVLVSRGGVLAPGETEVAGEREVLATWLLQRHDGRWKLAAYQNTPATA
ncbi:SgcJ/EcaC family oxidoreductase [Rhizohabitans arisaemae]|uniref:SgcJ/EcaC family oxidoreductase n=1 Tax=Rhizohabitans arisaemae TaxID=2720610 RepID=UPI0024B0958B|nr:SgcJ/EcaC family oxidoreductase [Rhizohabitans arisaemae]